MVGRNGMTSANSLTSGLTTNGVLPVSKSDFAVSQQRLFATSRPARAPLCCHTNQPVKRLRRVCWIAFATTTTQTRGKRSAMFTARCCMTIAANKDSSRPTPLTLYRKFCFALQKRFRNSNTIPRKDVFATGCTESCITKSVAWFKRESPTSRLPTNQRWKIQPIASGTNTFTITFCEQLWNA